MKLCVVDGSIVNLGDLSYKQFEKFGELTVFNSHTHSVEEVVRRVADADIVIGDGPDLPPGLTDACPNIKLICVMATGYDAADVEGSRKNGVPLCNVPNYGTHSVSQYAISLLLEICGNAAFYSDAVHDGKWFEIWDHCAGEHKLIELAGKTMGVIGFGNIGRSVGTIARALGMKVLAYNRSRCAEGEAIAEYVSLEELLERSDVISLHTPLTEATKHIINKESIAKMKDGVIIINNGRGPLVDSAALADALHSGKVYAAGLDVIEGEPDVWDNPLLKAPRCLITPHISWLPKESRQKILDITEANIQAFLDGKPQNVVNGL